MHAVAAPLVRGEEVFQINLNCINASIDWTTLWDRSLMFVYPLCCMPTSALLTMFHFSGGGILTNVEGVGDKAKRDVLRRSPVTIGHIAWDEAMVRILF